MKKGSRVFVLGAGASVSLDFPTGAELLREICKNLQKKQGIFQNLVNMGFLEDELREFGNSLDLSLQPSVDSFLERRPDFLTVGKAAIAAALIKREIAPQLSRSMGKGKGWVEYVFQQLGRTKDEFPIVPISFITFNYDRSLEAALLLAVQNSFRLSEETAVEVLGRVPIHHIYGQLGLLPFQGAPNRP